MKARVARVSNHFVLTRAFIGQKRKHEALATVRGSVYR